MGRKSRADTRKPEIVEHLYKVMTTEGLQGATLSKVAESMGVNSSLLIHYFKSKDDMLVALVDFLGEEYTRYFNDDRPKWENIQDDQDRIEAFVDAIFEPEWDEVVDKSVFWACFYLGFRYKRVRARFRRMFLQYKENLVGELRGLFGEKDSSSENLERIAVSVISLLEGYAYYLTGIGDDSPDKEHLAYIKGVAKNLLTMELAQRGKWSEAI